MIRFCLAIIASLIVSNARAAEPPTLPTSARLLIGIECKTFSESALIRKDAEPWRQMTADPRKGLELLGIEPAKVERIWIAAGDDYPRGTIMMIEGDFDVKKIEASWQQHARDKKYGASSHRVGEQHCVSYDLPPTVLPIPGMPGTIFVTSLGPKSIGIAFDKESLATKSDVAGKEVAKSPLVTAFPKNSTFALIAMPPPVMTSTQGLLPSVKQIIAQLKLDDSFNLQLAVTSETGDAAQAFLESVRNVIDQIRRVFPPLAKQQNVDPRLIQFVSTLTDAARVEKSDDRVEVRIHLTGDEFRKAIAKP